LYSKKITAAAAYTSITASLALTLTLILVFGFTESAAGAGFGTVLKTGIGRSPFIGVCAMALSMIVTPVVSLFTKKPPEETIDKAFTPTEEENS
jgi:Na+(H+)/acetate symporter ActP